MQNKQELLSVITLLAFGVFLILYSLLGLEIGTPRRMSVGFFPLVLGILLVVISGLMAFTYDRARVTKILIDWRACGFVSVAMIVFGLTLRPLGLLPAVMLLCVIASLASRYFHLKTALIVGATVGILTYTLFVVLLDVQLPLIGGWL